MTERAEELLEALWVAVVEKKKSHQELGVLKDAESLKELEACRCVDVKSDQIYLTEKGNQEGRNCVRRHRLAERLFVDVFDLKKTEAHGPSCKFEHLLHEGLDENVCTLLGHPTTCPHGKPIPAGNCCKDLKKAPGKLLMQLCELGAGKKAKVSYLQTHDQTSLQKIIAMGALPGTEISLVQKFPSYVFKIGKTQFAIDKKLACHIYVRMI
ncbi:metal-dependent transcriptional regulator [Candidatus Omnitrophota bacterium]